jgi:S1-C subfamily serine protease
VEADGEKGVLVTGVRAETRAFEYGLRAGDVVLGVNRQRVRSVAELSRALRKSGGLSLNVVRGDFLLTIQIR